MNLFLIVNACRSLRLALLCLLDGPFLCAKLFVLNLKARCLNVVGVVLLELSCFYRASFLKDEKRKSRALAGLGQKILRHRFDDLDDSNDVYVHIINIHSRKYDANSAAEREIER